MAALEGATTVAAMWAILQPYLINMLIVMAASKIFVKLFGEQFAFLAALAAACYGMYGGYEAGGMANATWAQNLVQVSTSVISEVAQSYEKQLQGIQDDLSDFSSYIDAKNDELEKLDDLLGQTTHSINPFVMLGESPSNCYARTVHAGNVGATCFDMLENYVDLNLRLPDFAQTIKNFETT